MDSRRSSLSAPEIPRARRAMTSPTPAPASTSPQQSRPSSPSRPATSGDDLVETLYSHPSVRIISFTTSQSGFATSSNKGTPPGSLPPSSRLERTIAVGAFRIYRAPGSVAFLSCGSALQPILPRSQCWCIDEDNSRFVLQIRRPQYWRIEVPVADPEDVHRAVLLRDVLDKILLFEKTECPFERSFTVELPDPPETPVKKKAWTAEGKNLLSSPFSDLSPPAHEPIAISRGSWATGVNPDMSPLDLSPLRTRLRVIDEAQGEVSLVARDQSFRQSVKDIIAYFQAHPVDDDLSGIARARSYIISNCDNNHSIQALEQTLNSLISSQNNIHQKDSLSNRKENNGLEPIRSDGEDGPSSLEGSGGVAPVDLTRKRRTRMLAGRSFTAPPPRRLATTPTKSNEPVTAVKESQPPSTPAGVRSSSTSTDSFHSVTSWQSPNTPPLASPRSGESSSEAESFGLPESPSPATYSSNRIVTPKSTVSADPSSSVSDSCGSEEPTPRSVRFVTDKKSKESIDGEDEPRMSRLCMAENNVQFHRRRSHAGSVSISRRALSPLPPVANLFTPPPPRPISQSRLAVVRRLPAAIIHRTMEILLGPPAHLIKLMLKVAAKIIAGEWKGLVFGVGEAGERIPVQWDYSDGEFSDLSDSDDYAPQTHNSNYNDRVPRAGVRRRTKSRNDNDHDGFGVD